LKNTLSSITRSGFGNDRPGKHTVAATHWHKLSGDNIAEELGGKSRPLNSSGTALSLGSSRSASDSGVYRKVMDTRERRDLKPISGHNDSSIYHSGLGGPPSDTLPHGLARYIGLDGYGYNHFPTNEGSPVRDGSTVGNIYTHYMTSEDTDSLIDDEQSLPSASRNHINGRYSNHGFPSSPPVLRSKNLFPVDTSNKRPPNFSLPKGAPNQYLSVQQLAPSTSQAMSHATSYGDTGMLLDVGNELQVTPEVPSLPHGNNQFKSQQVRNFGSQFARYIFLAGVGYL
jgi:hypothetical protein